jgi:hypothetical protein
MLPLCTSPSSSWFWCLLFIPVVISLSFSLFEFSLVGRGGVVALVGMHFSSLVVLSFLCVVIVTDESAFLHVSWHFLRLSRYFPFFSSSLVVMLLPHHKQAGCRVVASSLVSPQIFFLSFFLCFLLIVAQHATEDRHRCHYGVVLIRYSLLLLTGVCIHLYTCVCVRLCVFVPVCLVCGCILAVIEEKV